MALSFFAFILILLALWFFRRIIAKIANQAEQATDVAITASDISLADQRNKLYQKAISLKEFHTTEEIQEVLKGKQVKK